MAKEPGRRRACLVVGQHLSHYRAGVYSQLQKDSQWEFIFAGGEKSRDANIPGIPRGVLNHVITLREAWLPWGLLWQFGLLQILARRRFDAVILSGSATHLSTWIAAAFLRLRKVPVLFWTIGWHRPDPNPIKRAVRILFYRLADLLLLYGKDGYLLGKSMGYPAERMRIVGNSYSNSIEGSADQDNPSSLELTDKASRTGVVYVGAVVRLTSAKRLDLLIDAVQLLRQRGYDVGVLLTGEGPAREALEKRAQGADVPALFTGAVHSSSTLNSIYDRLAVTVLPERAGLTVIQSLSRGTPVVTVDDPYRQVPEFRAVIPGETGELYRVGDVHHLAACIETWLERVAADPIGVAAACRAEIELNWSVDHHARKLLECLAECVQ